MAGKFHEYDPTQITVAVAGILCEGFADGEFVTVERDSDAFSDVVGTDGDVSRSRSSDKRGTITIKLLQTSPTNALLSALHEADLNTPGGAGVGQAVVRDRLNGATKFSANHAWIMKAPDVSLDRTATSREWKIRCADLSSFEGGSAIL